MTRAIPTENIDCEAPTREEIIAAVQDRYPTDTELHTKLENTTTDTRAEIQSEIAYSITVVEGHPDSWTVRSGIAEYELADTAEWTDPIEDILAADDAFSGWNADAVSDAASKIVHAALQASGVTDDAMPTARCAATETLH